MNAVSLAESSVQDCDFHAFDSLCLDALRHEAMAWPKPGLVTPVDSGSHHDMNIGTFLASIDALQGSFARLARAGSRGESFAALQAIGIEAEKKMHRATGGINTHRGAIFNLGLLVAAAASRSEDAATAYECGAIVAKLWGKEISAGRRLAAASHGNSVFSQFAAGGARAQAAAGFPAVYHIGLPALRHHLRAGHSEQTAQIATLLALMEHLPDTNLLWRAGDAGLDFVRGAAADFNRAGSVGATGWQDHLLVMHREFVARNLSPGGSADLMAASWLVHQLEPDPSS